MGVVMYYPEKQKDPILEYLDDLPLFYDATIAAMRGTLDPIPLLQSISKRFVKISHSRDHGAWAVASGIINQVIEMRKAGNNDEAIRVMRNLKSRCLDFANVTEISKVGEIFKKNSDSRIYTTLSTCLKSIPKIKRDLSDGDMKMLQSVIHDVEHFVSDIICLAKDMIEPLLFFTNLERAFKKVRSLLLANDQTNAKTMLFAIQHSLTGYKQNPLKVSGVSGQSILVPRILAA